MACCLLLYNLDYDTFLFRSELQSCISIEVQALYSCCNGHPVCYVTERRTCICNDHCPGLGLPTDSHLPYVPCRFRSLFPPLLSLIQEGIQSQEDCSQLLQGFISNYARWVSNVGGSVALLSSKILGIQRILGRLQSGLMQLALIANSTHMIYLAANSIAATPHYLEVSNRVGWSRASLGPDRPNDWQKCREWWRLSSVAMV